MRTNHGVLHRIEESEHYYTILKSGFLCWFGSEPIACLEALLQHAEEYELSHLWIMPGAVYKPDVAFAERYNESHWNILHHYKGEGEQARLRTVTGWRRGGGNQFTIIFCENTQWYANDAWLSKVTGPQLLEVVAQVENALGVQMAGSPQSTGWRLVKLYHPEWIADYPKINMRAAHFTPRAARDMIESISPKKRKKYLHKFDKAGHYLAAAASTEIGCGTPVKQFFYDPKSVGVYKTIVKGYSTPKMILSPYTSEWLMTPHIRVLGAAKAILEIEEGNIFPEHHKVLAQWAKTLWEAKSSLFGYAQEAIKQIYTSTLGFSNRVERAANELLESGEEEKDTSLLEKNRRDIRLQVRARGYEIMWHNINTIFEATGEIPDIVYNDAVYYEADEADGRKAYPDVVKREGLLGGFKWEGCIEVDDEVWKLLQDDCSPAQKLTILNERGWHYASEMSQMSANA